MVPHPTLDCPLPPTYTFPFPLHLPATSLPIKSLKLQIIPPNLRPFPCPPALFLVVDLGQVSFILDIQIAYTMLIVDLIMSHKVRGKDLSLGKRFAPEVAPCPMGSMGPKHWSLKKTGSSIYITYFVYVLKIRRVLIPMGRSWEGGDFDSIPLLFSPLYPPATPPHPTPHLSSLIFTPALTGPLSLCSPFY